MSDTPAAVLVLGLLLGMRHALDVDHLAAVGTIVSQRSGVCSSSLVGALWGLGHTAALLVVAVAMIVLRVRIPAHVGQWLELGVAAMLIGLGTNLLRTLWRGGHVHSHPHVHDGRPHIHPHVHAMGERDAHRHGPSQRRPFLVGMVHGLAGSAGLMLAVLTTIPAPALALAYVALFGLGSVGGMIAMSALLGLPMTLAARRFGRAEWWLRACAAVGSVAVGLRIAWTIGIETGLLL